ncbi:Acetyl esterase/lipase [Methylobacterium sp. 190mf]|uniref:alpha/beta hydrolase fold domain-containing protein n=1 Tax=Methylobacterium sp. 190mf TaxID=1761798 RepID=UPI0006B02D5B|nr:alpha/beta hydrolase [Methylobacterium sp. 190mf]SEG40989.1 Acetyl esterase/lipase [Methylobacterium sp. 190mf]
MRRRLQVGWDTTEGCEVYRIAPRNRTSAGQVLYLHGGAYVHDITAPHWRFITRMAEATGLTFTVPLYPLAPVHTCADASRAVTAVYRRLLDKHPGSPVAVMGDSAGGGLSLSLAMQLRDAGLPPPRCLVLLSPWLDVTMCDPPQASIERSDVMLMRPGLEAAGRWYAGAWSPRDARVSPLFGNLAGLPPILMFCGSHDILVADARRLAERVVHEGPGRGLHGRLDLAYHEEPGLMHVYAILPLPEARRAQAKIATFLRERMAKPSAGTAI